jgi:long-chain acyl-CoA synthetase
MYLAGTHEAMPKGRYLPRRGERVEAHVGPFMTYEQVVAIAASKRARAEQYRAITHEVESVVRRLAPPEHTWSLGETGVTPRGDAGAKPAQGDAEETR